MGNLFKGLIICKSCSKRFNYKEDNGNLIYVCSGYKNYGSKFCKRNILREIDLINLVELHLSTSNKNVILKDVIDRIEVDGESVTIYYLDGTKTEWCNSKLEV